jgi:hypothetical protein
MTGSTAIPQRSEIRAAFSKAGLAEIDNDILSKCKLSVLFQQSKYSSLQLLIPSSTLSFVSSFYIFRRWTVYESGLDTRTNGRMLGSL